MKIVDSHYENWTKDQTNNQIFPTLVMELYVTIMEVLGKGKIGWTQCLAQELMVFWVSTPALNANIYF